MLQRVVYIPDIFVRITVIMRYCYPVFQLLLVRLVLKRHIYRFTKERGSGWFIRLLYADGDVCEKIQSPDGVGLGLVCRDMLVPGAPRLNQACLR